MKSGSNYKVTHFEKQKQLSFLLTILAGEDVQIELSGSPAPITRQKPGVLYALNCGGPAYQAINDVVYSSEFYQYSNFSYDCCAGELPSC